MRSDNYPQGTRVAEPLEAGLSLVDWEQHDPDGYTAAVRESITGDELTELLAEIAGNGSVEGYRSIVRERMNQRLAKEASDGKPWVFDWGNRFAAADED